MIKYCTFSWK